MNLRLHSIDCMAWEQYLALLNWQGQKIHLQDFEDLRNRSIQSPEEIPSLIQNPKVKAYTLENKNWLKTVKEQLLLCEEKSIQLTWPGEPHYPKPLNFYKNAPTLISYKGPPSWQNHFSFCVVGSRKSSPETLAWMDHFLGPFLSSNKKIILLSGGARGIDQKSHSLALRVGRPTLCFLPCGILNFYPESLQNWEAPILKGGGAFISPFPPHLSIRKSFFHYRNALMVRMSQLVLAAQAEKRSGSMLTARLAGLYGVTLCTLPGPALNPLFSGNLDLINNGAFMIRDKTDLQVLYDSHI